MANPIIEKALKLQQEAENARNEAIQSLLKSRDEITEQLKALGHSDGIIKKATSAVKRAADPNKPCPKCGELGHDGRFHRGDKKKAPKKEAAAK